MSACLDILLADQRRLDAAAEAAQRTPRARFEAHDAFRGVRMRLSAGAMSDLDRELLHDAVRDLRAAIRARNQLEAA